MTKQYLEAMGFAVTWCDTGNAAYEAYIKQPAWYNILIIDIQLPDINGFELAKKITDFNKEAYFLFLTARAAKKDRLLGLGIGASDYISKPFDIDELVLRIRNIVRRQEPIKNETDDHSNIIEVGDIRLNKALLNLNINGKSSTTLTPRETELFEYLYVHRNTIVKREEILVHLWGENDYFMGRSLDVFISRLRKLLKQSTSGMKIENVYGVGFILSVPE